MRRLTIFLSLLAVLLMPRPAFAEEHSWEADQPKGLGPGSLRCTMVSEYRGNTVRHVNYVAHDPNDGYDMLAYARRTLAQDAVNVHTYKFGNPGADPADVQITCEPIR